MAYCLVKVAYSFLRNFGAFSAAYQGQKQGPTNLSDLGRFCIGGLVVPVLEVFVDGQFMCNMILTHHGTKPFFLHLAMHDLVEGRISRVVLGF